MSVTVVVTHYLRSANVALLLETLRRQTVKPVLFVWDNSPGQDFDDPGVDWVIRSSRNAQCAPRWWMASHASTDLVLIHDDDLMPAHSRVLATTVDAAARAAPFAIGSSGVILDHHLGYWHSRHVGFRADRMQRDLRVDIVKGCFFCCPTQQLSGLSHLELDTEDDIAVSARLGRGLRQPHIVAARLQTDLVQLPEGEAARKCRAGHRAARDIACWRFFGGASRADRPDRRIRADRPRRR
jgi:hypothetical protein